MKSIWYFINLDPGTIYPDPHNWLWKAAEVWFPGQGAVLPDLYPGYPPLPADHPHHPTNIKKYYSRDGPDIQHYSRDRTDIQIQSND